MIMLAMIIALLHFQEQVNQYTIPFFPDLFVSEFLKLLDTGILYSGLLHHEAPLYQTEHTHKQIHLWNWVEVGIMSVPLLCCMIGY